ncbi:hypothetical protein KI387_032094, partial [Taxus chinensis]
MGFLLSMAEDIRDHVLQERPHLEPKVPKNFPSAMHYVCTLVDMVLEEGPVRMPTPKDLEQEVERAKATIIRKISSYEALLQTNVGGAEESGSSIEYIIQTPEVVIRIRTMVEDNEVLKSMKDETLGHVERLTLVKQKCEALAATQEPHKNRLDELGKLIAQKMDLLEGRISAMANIMYANTASPSLVIAPIVDITTKASSSLDDTILLISAFYLHFAFERLAIKVSDNFFFPINQIFCALVEFWESLEDSSIVVVKRVLLTEIPSLPPLYHESPAAVHELTLARDIFEHAVVLSVKNEDQDAFERDFLQLKPYYTDTRGFIPPSSQEYPILGLNLLRLLVQNRIAEFHTELELLSPEALDNVCIRHAVELEQSFMEGAYNRVLSARQAVPHETYIYFMDLLAKTVRDEIGGCSEKAYDYLSLQHAKQILMFSSNQELEEYVGEEHPEWEFRNGCLYFEK